MLNFLQSLYKDELAPCPNLYLTQQLAISKVCHLVCILKNRAMKCNILWYLSTLTCACIPNICSGQHVHDVLSSTILFLFFSIHRILKHCLLCESDRCWCRLALHLCGKNQNINSPVFFPCKLWHQDGSRGVTSKYLLL